MTSKFPYPGITGVKFTLLHSAEGYSDIDSLNQNHEDSRRAEPFSPPRHDNLTY